MSRRADVSYKCAGIWDDKHIPMYRKLPISSKNKTRFGHSAGPCGPQGVVSYGDRGLAPARR